MIKQVKEENAHEEERFISKSRQGTAHCTTISLIFKRLLLILFLKLVCLFPFFYSFFFNTFFAKHWPKKDIQVCAVIQCLLHVYLPFVFTDKYWRNSHNRRRFFIEFAAQKGFDPLVAANWKNRYNQVKRTRYRRKNRN